MKIVSSIAHFVLFANLIIVCFYLGTRESASMAPAPPTPKFSVNDCVQQINLGEFEEGPVVMRIERVGKERYLARFHLGMQGYAIGPDPQSISYIDRSYAKVKCPK